MYGSGRFEIQGLGFGGLCISEESTDRGVISECAALCADF